MASQDYEEFIAALNRRGMRYLIVGAHAVAFHARPRATEDLDLLLDRTPANASKVVAALRDFFGGAELGYPARDFLDPEWVIQLGVAPVRIDLMFSLGESFRFRGLWKNKIKSRFGKVKAYYLGFDDLVRAKETTGRAQDSVDVRVLRSIRGRHRRVKHSSGAAGSH